MPRPRRLFALSLPIFLIVAGLACTGTYVWAQWQLRAAQRSLEQFRFQEARSRLERYLQFWPRSSHAHLLLAQAARRDHDYETADAHLNEAQRLLHGLTDEIVLERLMLRAQTGDVDGVTAYLRNKADENGPERVLILEAMAFGYIQLQRLQEADLMLQLLFKSQPENPRAWMMQGWVKEMLGQTEESADCYRHVVDKDGDDDQARLLMANALLESHHPGEAIEHFELLNRRLPDNPSVQVRRAQCQYDLGQFSEAEQTLDAVLARYPHFGTALKARGRVALHFEQLGQAEQWFRKAIAAEAWDHQAHYELYQCLNRAGKDDDAKKLQVRMKEIETDMRRLQDIVSKDLGHRPNDPNLNFEAGVIFMRVGQTSKGLDWLYRSLRADPRFSPAHAVLSEHFEYLGNKQRAAFHRQYVQPGTNVPRLHLSDLPQP